MSQGCGIEYVLSEIVSSVCSDIVNWAHTVPVLICMSKSLKAVLISVMLVLIPVFKETAADKDNLCPYG